MSKLPLIIVAAAALVFGSPPAAHASTLSTFTFTGTCGTFTGNCSGTATGTLVLQNYTQGNDITLSNFVSFTYHSNIVDLSLTGTGTAAGEVSQIGFGGNPSILPVNLPATANVTLYTSTQPTGIPIFNSETVSTGFWCSGPGTPCGLDGGDVSSWSATPLPAALPLFATGLGALGLLGWRRKRKAQVA
jgi:hypothetical protein